MDHSKAASSSQIRVVTFDLDDTIWQTSATISAANDALADFVNAKLNRDENVVRVENAMGTLYGADKAKYAPIEQGGAKAPVLLTQLRKDAIRQVLVDNGMDDDDESTNELVEEAFQVWVNARHQTIPNHFAESVVSCLKEIYAMRTMDGADVVVGAITDGNSDPLAIPEISDYFDFCINAESVGISKPDKRVYLKGVARALQHPSLRDFLSSASSVTIEEVAGEMTDEAMEDLVGPWWVHIGDDFVKDCVAAKNLNMRTIWARELVRDKLINQEVWKTAAESSQQERTVEQLVKEISELEVVEMQVGADNYLATSLQEEFADAVTDTFQGIATVLRQWQHEATLARSPVSTSETTPSEESEELPEYFELIQPDSSTQLESREVGAKVVDGDAISSDSKTKFCIHCGEKLPLVAKFCSACGEKQ